jgi:hypothetical protein
MHHCAETSNQRFFVMLVGYMRVSSESDRQITDLQRDALLAAGVDGRHLFEDHASGAKDDRLGLNQALTFVRPGDVLVVWKLDRLGRSLSHLLCIVNTLKEKQVAFRSLTEGMDTTTASGELLFHVFGALAQYGAMPWTARMLARTQSRYACARRSSVSRTIRPEAKPNIPQNVQPRNGASLSGVADRLVAFEEFGVGGVGQLNPPRRSRINPA